MAQWKVAQNLSKFQIYFTSDVAQVLLHNLKKSEFLNCCEFLYTSADIYSRDFVFTHLQHKVLRLNRYNQRTVFCLASLLQSIRCSKTRYLRFASRLSRQKQRDSRHWYFILICSRVPTESL